MDGRTAGKDTQEGEEGGEDGGIALRRKEKKENKRT